MPQISQELLLQWCSIADFNTPVMKKEIGRMAQELSDAIDQDVMYNYMLNSPMAEELVDNFIFDDYGMARFQELTDRLVKKDDALCKFLRQVIMSFNLGDDARCMAIEMICASKAYPHLANQIVWGTLLFPELQFACIAAASDLPKEERLEFVPAVQSLLDHPSTTDKYLRGAAEAFIKRNEVKDV